MTVAVYAALVCFASGYQGDTVNLCKVNGKSILRNVDLRNCPLIISVQIICDLTQRTVRTGRDCKVFALFQERLHCFYERIMCFADLLLRTSLLDDFGRLVIPHRFLQNIQSEAVNHKILRIIRIEAPCKALIAVKVNAIHVTPCSRNVIRRNRELRFTEDNGRSILCNFVCDQHIFTENLLVLCFVCCQTDTVVLFVFRQSIPCFRERCFLRQSSVIHSGFLLVAVKRRYKFNGSVFVNDRECCHFICVRLRIFRITGNNIAVRKHFKRNDCRFFGFKVATSSNFFNRRYNIAAAGDFV